MIYEHLIYNTVGLICKLYPNINIQVMIYVKYFMMCFRIYNLNTVSTLYSLFNNICKTIDLLYSNTKYVSYFHIDQAHLDKLYNKPIY